MSKRYSLHRETFVTAPLSRVFEFFAAPENLARITPARMGFEILSAPEGPLGEGARISYRIRAFGIPLKWTTLITSWVPNVSFSDLQERGPYKYWMHVHTFEEMAGGVEMVDSVEYELPLGWLGRIAAPLVARELGRIFDHRRAVIREMFSPSA